MRKHLDAWSATASIAGGLLLLLATAALGREPAVREPIGEVLGRTVYRDEIRSAESWPLRDELHRLFAAPVMEQYRRQHKAEIVPTEAEIAAATAFFDKQHSDRVGDKRPQLEARLKVVDEQLSRGKTTGEERKKLEIERWRITFDLTPPGRFFAVFMLSNWKFQKHLYQHFGGGRILWQQAGIEAFDAHRAWLDAQQKQGAFKIADPKLRATFYEYWTTMKHGAFLTGDKDRIQRELLEPAWLPKSLR